MLSFIEWSSIVGEVRLGGAGVCLLLLWLGVTGAHYRTRLHYHSVGRLTQPMDCQIFFCRCKNSPPSEVKSTHHDKNVCVFVFKMFTRGNVLHIKTHVKNKPITAEKQKMFPVSEKKEKGGTSLV